MTDNNIFMLPLQYVFDRISDAKNLKDYQALTPKYAAPFVDKIKK